MIEIKEIRIGNYVQYNGSLIAIYAISELEVRAGETFHINTYQSYELEPIPLTPEILSACGFIKTLYEKQEQWLSPKHIRVQPYVEYQIGILVDDFGYYYQDAILIIRISSLHKLQNFIFALTGKELEYKP